MIINIHGADTCRSKDYLDRTISEFRKQRDPQGYNVVVLDAVNQGQNIVSEMRVAPFLAEKRMVVVNNILSCKDKELLQGIMAIIIENKVPSSNIVVFYQSATLGKVKEVKELEKLLKKEKYTQEFAKLSGIKLTSWISSEIKKRNATISSVALQYLTQNADDSWFLRSLLDQLAAYKGEEEIETKDVELFLEEKVDDNAFNMVDAVLSGNKKQATKLLEKQRFNGEDESKIFGLIVWQMRILLQMRDLFDREDNIPSDQIAKKIGIHPFVAKKNLYLVKRYSQDKLKMLHNQLLQIDYKTKTGRGDQSLLIDLFVNSF